MWHPLQSIKPRFYYYSFEQILFAHILYKKHFMTKCTSYCCKAKVLYRSVGFPKVKCQPHYWQGSMSRLKEGLVSFYLCTSVMLCAPQKTNKQ